MPKQSPDGFVMSHGKEELQLTRQSISWLSHMHKAEVKLACLRSTRGDGLHAHVRDHHLTLWSFNEGPQVIDRVGMSNQALRALAKQPGLALPPGLWSRFSG